MLNKTLSLLVAAGAGIGVAGCSSGGNISKITFDRCAHHYTESGLRVGMEPVDEEMECAAFVKGPVNARGYLPAIVIFENQGSQPVTFEPTETVFIDRNGEKWLYVPSREMSEDMKRKKDAGFYATMTFATIIGGPGAWIGAAAAEAEIKSNARRLEEQTFSTDTLIGPGESRRGYALVRKVDRIDGGTYDASAYPGGKYSLYFSDEAGRHEILFVLGQPSNIDRRPKQKGN